MRILLIVYNNDSFIHFFPLGLAYLASILRNEGHSITIYNQDLHHYPEEHLTKYLDSYCFDIVGIGLVAGYYPYKKLLKISEAINNSKNRRKFRYIIGGHMVSADPLYFCNKTGADAIFIGESDISIKTFCEKNERGFYKPILVENLDDLPLPAWDLFPMFYYKLQRMPNISNGEFSMSVITGRGCNFNCLQGDTIIDTLELGKQKIKDLVGKQVKVLTRNPITKDIEYAQSWNISLTRKNAHLVRVHFDNNTFIDCTPDHKFLTFYNGNQFVETREQEIEAKDLKPNQSVRAINYVKTPYGYIDVVYGRQQTIKQHRLIMEGILGRKIKKNERIHHIDKNKENNAIKNLQLTDTHNHFSDYHSEISERMKINNPAFNYTNKWKNNISQSLKGIKRTDEQKENYRLSKLGNKNPNFKGNKAKHKQKCYCKKCDRLIHYITFFEGSGMCGSCSKKEYFKIHPGTTKNKKRIHKLNCQCPFCKAKRGELKGNIHPRYKKSLEINHKVIRIEILPYTENVYCMEVPNYNWFFANGVLVHNCTFCFKIADGIRLRSIGSIMEEINKLYTDYGITYIDFADDLTLTSPKRTEELCEAILNLPFKIKWRCEGRLNFVKEEDLKLMKRSGCVFINYGIESLNKTVLKNIKKNLTKEQITNGVDLTLKEEISPGLNFMWGNIGDTEETLKESVDFLLKYDDGVQLRTIRPVTPYPGCELFETAKIKGLVKDTEDFYENKHLNSDLVSINFTDIPTDKMHELLHSANKALITSYYQKKLYKTIDECENLYINKNINFRGYRQT